MALVALVALTWVLLPAPPRAAFVPDVLDAGSVRVGETGPELAFELRNEGERRLRIRALDFPEPAAAHFEVDSECVGRELLAGDSCASRLRFRPQSPGDHATGLRVVGNDRTDPQLLVRATATAPALEIRPASLDFGVVPLEAEAAEREVTLVNSGSALLELGRIRIEGAAADEFSRSRRCPDTTLEPGETCTFDVRFLPAVSGERTALVLVDSDAFGGRSTLELAGTGLWQGPPLDPESDRLDFEEQPVGIRSAPRELRFVNRTGGTVAVETTEVEGTATVAIVEDACRGREIPSGGECILALTFLPIEEGRERAVLELSAAGATETTRVELGGRGVTPRMAAERRELVFPEQRSGFESSPHAVLFRNTGTATLTPGPAVVRAEGEAFRIRDNACTGRALAPGKSCRLGVAFRPRRAGESAAVLTLEPGFGLDPVPVALRGRGIVSALEVDTSRVDFGRAYVGQATKRRIVLRNGGDARLTVARLRFTGEGASAFRVAGLGCTLDAGLAPGSSCAVDLAFVATELSPTSALLIVEHNGPDSPARIQVAGAGRERTAAFRVSRQAFTFGRVAVGSRSGIETLTIENPGVEWLPLRGISVRGEHAEDFEMVAGTCDGASAVAPGGSCTVGIRFVPVAAGSRRAQLSIRHGAAGSPAAVELGGSGTSAP